MSDIDLIVGADSPFPRWVREAVRDLRTECRRLEGRVEAYEAEAQASRSLVAALTGRTDTGPTFEQLLADPDLALEPLPVLLCDADGIVRRGMFHDGTDYPCTGSAHTGPNRVLKCTNPVHVMAAYFEAGEPS